MIIADPDSLTNVLGLLSLDMTDAVIGGDRVVGRGH